MTSHSEDTLHYPDGTLNPAEMKRLAREYYAASDAAALDSMLALAIEHSAGTFESAYSLFQPVLRLLDNYNPFAKASAIDVTDLVAQWAKALGLAEKSSLNAMLALKHPIYATEWLMEAGADPNEALTPSAPENLTILGHTCRVMAAEERENDTVREMIRVVLARGDVPYSIKPRYEGDLAARDLFDAVMSNDCSTGNARRVLFEAMGMVSDRGELAIEAREALGRACLIRSKLEAFEGVDLGEHVSYEILSYAKFPDPLDWERAFEGVGSTAQMNVFLSAANPARRARLINALVRDGARIDEVRVSITEDTIPCTLLQAAAFSGKEDTVRQLIEADADPGRTVGAGSENYPIAHLDAKGLWDMNPYRQPSQALGAWKAREAIGSIIGRAMAGASTANNPS